MDEITFLRRVLYIFAKADARDDLFWTFVEEGELVMYAMCSDTFEWGTADLELITREDLPLLEQTYQDLRKVTVADRTHAYAVAWTAELYAARKRRMRPQGAVYENMPPEIHPLFDACGPVREVDIFNPKEQP